MWGMERMFLVRGGKQILEIFATSGSDVEHVIEMQNVWGFGQVLSLALLVLPLASLFGELTGSPIFHHHYLSLPLNQEYLLTSVSRCILLRPLLRYSAGV